MQHRNQAFNLKRFWYIDYKPVVLVLPIYCYKYVIDYTGSLAHPRIILIIYNNLHLPIVVILFIHI